VEQHYDAIWTPGETASVETSKLWSDRVLRVDGIDVESRREQEGVYNWLFVYFTIFRSDNPAGTLNGEFDPVLDEWKKWVDDSGFDWAFRDSAESTFDSKVFDFFWLPDRDLIGGSIEVTGHLAAEYQIPENAGWFAWPSPDLEWLDVAFGQTTSSQRPEDPALWWTHSSLPDSELADRFVVRVMKPLMAEFDSLAWPFQWANPWLFD
jgi:hypothetical protein